MPHSDPDDLAWYENFFENRVLPKACKDMGEYCQGFFTYLVENDPGLYNRITAAQDHIGSLWLSRADRESFKAACKTWYSLLMEAKQGFEARKIRQREAAASVGKQEAMELGQ